MGEETDTVRVKEAGPGLLQVVEVSSKLCSIACEARMSRSEQTTSSLYSGRFYNVFMPLESNDGVDGL
jgi:hypothetical protein